MNLRLRHAAVLTSLFLVGCEKVSSSSAEQRAVGAKSAVEKTEAKTTEVNLDFASEIQP